MASKVRQLAPNVAGRVSPKGEVVLEYFPNGDALVYRGHDPQGGQPFVWAQGYDPATGEWSQGKYYGNPTEAYNAADPEVVEDWCVTWTRDDVREKLEESGYEATDRNVAEVVGADKDQRYRYDSLSPATAGTTAGWEALEARIEALAEDRLLGRRASEDIRDAAEDMRGTWSLVCDGPEKGLVVTCVNTLGLGQWEVDAWRIDETTERWEMAVRHHGPVGDHGTVAELVHDLVGSEDDMAPLTHLQVATLFGGAPETCLGEPATVEEVRNLRMLASALPEPRQQAAARAIERLDDLEERLMADTEVKVPDAAEVLRQLEEAGNELG